MKLAWCRNRSAAAVLMPVAVGIPDNLSVEETLARDALPRM